MSGVGVVDGGGFYNDYSAQIIRTTISGNLINAGEGNGGGIYSQGSYLTVINSTVSGNSISASNFARGGGICAAAGELKHVTAAGNRIASQVTYLELGGGVYTAGNALSLTNTLIGNNAGVSTPDVYGAFASQGSNLIGNPTGGSGWDSTDILNVNPRTGALGNYGGAAPTVPLFSDSPAINAGRNGNAPPTDQRGAARIVGGRIDIGAFESETYPGYAADVNGRFTTASGRSVPLSPVVLTSVYGEKRYAFTNAFGYYRFKNVPAGIGYTLHVRSKKYDLSPTTIVLTGNR